MKREATPLDDSMFKRILREFKDAASRFTFAPLANVEDDKEARTQRIEESGQSFAAVARYLGDLKTSADEEQKAKIK